MCVDVRVGICLDGPLMNLVHHLFAHIFTPKSLDLRHSDMQRSVCCLSLSSFYHSIISSIMFESIIIS